MSPSIAKSEKSATEGLGAEVPKIPGQKASKTGLSTAEDFGRYSASLRVGELPDEVVAKSKLCVIDCLAACVTVAASAEARAAIHVMTSQTVTGNATIFGTAYRTDPASAAYINSISASATVCSDTHRQSASHPGMVIIPAVLALAEMTGASGSRVLRAIIVGYEMMCRLGTAVITPDIAAVHRPSGIIGPAGAAIACANLLNLDARAQAVALSLACNSAAGYNEWAAAGSNEHVFHSAVAARSGLEAALLAQRGVEAALQIFEGRAGLLAAFDATAKVDQLTSRLGSDHRILRVIHKPAPTCIFTQGPCQLAAELVGSTVLDVSQIESIEVRVTRAAAEYPGCDFAGALKGRAAAIMSIQFVIASILVAGGIHDANWDRFADPAISDLGSRCWVIVDDALTAAYPEKNGTHLKVQMRDGTIITLRQDDFLGMTAQEVTDRFLLNATAVLGHEKAQAVVEAVFGLDEANDLLWLSTLLTTVKQPGPDSGRA